MIEKKCVGDKKKLREWTTWFIAIHSAFDTWFSFSINKKQKKLQS
jgi:hypothetical protein